MLDARGLVNLGRSSRDNLDIYSWWISLAAKLSVYERMDLVADTATDENMEMGVMKPNTLGMYLPLLYLFLILLIRLNTEVRRFIYSGIRRENCEFTLCSSPLGESRVAASRLTSVGFCALLEWLTW